MTSSHLREVSADGVILPGDVAAELYAARLHRGVELRDVAKELRIQYDYLLAIEEGRFSDLPGPAYVIGFLRSYALYLGLDSDEMVRRFKTETTEFDARQNLNALEPYDEGGVPTGALIALALVLAAGAYGGWYYVTNLNDIALERVPEVPERMVAAIAPEESAAPPVAVEAVSSDQPAAPEPEPAPVVEAVSSAEPVEAEPVDAGPVETEPVEAETVEAGPVEAGPVEAEPVTPEPEAPPRETSAPAPDVVLSDEPFEAILAAAIEQSTVDEAAPETEPETEIDPAPAPETELEPVLETEPGPAPRHVLETTPLPQQALPEPVSPEPVSNEPVSNEPSSSGSTAAEALETASLQPAIPAPVIEPSDYQPRVFGRANAGSAITLRAREESWVQVTGDNNELLLTRILRPGDVYHVPDRKGLMLMTGNAGGIEILVGDKLAPALGEVGKVRRQVALDPVRLLAGTAVDP